MNQKSWKKLTLSILAIVAMVIQVFIGSDQVSNGDNAAYVITGQLVTLIGWVAFIITQGKIDLAKLTSSGAGAAILSTVVEKAADALEPVIDSIERTGKEFSGDSTASAVTTAAVSHELKSDARSLILQAVESQLDDYLAKNPNIAADPAAALKKMRITL